MEYKNYYETLGLTENATSDEVKKAYRKLALKYHPDSRPDDSDARRKFQEISEANEVLGDPAKRRKYDEFGQDTQEYQEPGNGGAGGFSRSQNARQPSGGEGRTTFRFSGEDGDAVPADFFETLFGMKFSDAKGTRASTKGGDAVAEAPITLEEAYHGTTRVLQVDHQTIRVRIKPGSADQQILRIRGKGAPGYNDGPAGDLIIKLVLLPHAFFERRQDDLYCAVVVDLYTALLGGSAKVKTFTGSANMNVPAGTGSGRVLKMSGLGMSVYGKKDERGDLYATVDVRLPTNLSVEEKELFERLRELNKKKRE